MNFSEIIGQRDIIERLRTLADEDRLPHALMLCGPQGCGKMAIAMALASYVLCTGRHGDGSMSMFGDEEESAKMTDSCGTCPSCMMLRKWQHPDLHFSYPIYRKKGLPSDKKPTSDDFAQEWFAMLESNGPYFSLQGWLEEIKVDTQQSLMTVAESDRITQALMMKSNQGGKKISLIWLPEKMNEECENKILKLLEEPPSETLFILVSNNPERLLETIRSRVQRFDVKPITQEELTQALIDRRGLNSDDARRIARIADGSWTKAIELLEPGNESVQFFDLYVMLMRKAYMRDVRDLKKWADQVATLGRERQLRMLTAFQRLTRENFMYNFGNKDLIYMSQEEETFAVKFARFVNERNVIGMYELYARAMRDIAQNANARILFFDVAMKMAVMIRK